MLDTLLDYGGFNLHELVFTLVAEVAASRRVSLSGFYFVCIGQVRVVLLQDLASTPSTLHAVDYVLVIEAGLIIAGWTHPDCVLVNSRFHVSGR